MNRNRAIMACAGSGIVGACYWGWASARAGEEEDGQRVRIKIWIVDVSSLKPGEKPHVKGFGATQTRLGRPPSKHGSLQGGPRAQSWTYSVTTHDPTFPTRTEVLCDYSVGDETGTISGQMTLHDGHLGAALSEDGSYLLLLQLVGL